MSSKSDCWLCLWWFDLEVLGICVSSISVRLTRLHELSRRLPSVALRTLQLHPQCVVWDISINHGFMPIFIMHPSGFQEWIVLNRHSQLHICNRDGHKLCTLLLLKSTLGSCNVYLTPRTNHFNAQTNNYAAPNYMVISFIENAT